MDRFEADAARGRTPGAQPSRRRVDPAAFAEAVLGLTELIPCGSVLTYGDVAELLDRGGPRQVGRALSRSTRNVPWWRVLRSGGQPPQGLAIRARVHYDDEGTILCVRTGTTDPAEYRVDLRHARWTPSESEHVLIGALTEGLGAGEQGPTARDAPVRSNVRGV